MHIRVFGRLVVVVIARDAVSFNILHLVRRRLLTLVVNDYPGQILSCIEDVLRHLVNCFVNIKIKEHLGQRHQHKFCKAGGPIVQQMYRCAL